MLPFHVRTSVLALAIAAAFPQVQAQTAASGDEVKKDTTQLEAVIVTGGRRVENLKDVPLSISAIKGEALENVSVGGADIRALSARVPSLNIESDFGRSFPRRVASATASRITFFNAIWFTPTGVCTRNVGMPVS